MNDSTPVLRVRDLTKRYGDNTVLDRVSIEVGRHEIVGIVGENGAGKTTLFNILSGVVEADSGQVELNGQEIDPRDYHSATLLGISRVFQEQALIPNIKVYENLLLSHEALFTRALQFIDGGKMIAAAEAIVREGGLDIDVTRRTSDYSFSKRQLIEIARACLVPSMVLGIEHPVVLLDEPTAALEKSDEERFFDLMKRLKARGSLVFVSHRLTEILEACDTVYVLKDGKLVARLRAAEANEHMLHGLMVGRERDADYYHEGEQRDVSDQAVVFQTEGLSSAGRYSDVSLEVYAGEVLGIGGLLDSGKSEFGKGAMGIVAPDRGTVTLSGHPAHRPEVRDLVGKGVGYVPAERLTEGMISPFPLAWNVTMASGGDIFANRLGIWRSQHEIDVTERSIELLKIKADHAKVPCERLSGGNQQKVVLARWLCRPLKVLILDNPTRGVDAGAKEEIYQLIRGLTADGVAVILITDDLLELIGLSNRIAIMQRGRVAKTVAAAPDGKPSERQLIELMLSSDAKVAGSRGPRAAEYAEAVVA
ncbi:MAG TPA: sugar ABC transporter ATP-binding protein [Kiloniellales bacterium]|jgi:ribose transport system ATP-binding protein